MELNNYVQEIKGKLLNKSYDLVKLRPPYEKGSRGIVTASGSSSRLLQSLVSISIVRKTGCTLPIELFYADEEEMYDDIKMILEFELNVKCVNVQQHAPFEHYNARNFSIKSISIYLSSFEEVLWMDADVIPFQDMTTLFEDAHYVREGYMFFNDIFSDSKYENAMSKSSRTFCEAFGMPIVKGAPETDSGVFLINKLKVPEDFLSINALLNMDHEITYKYNYGDKELYKLSMWLCDKSIYTTTDVYPKMIGLYFEKEALFCGNGVVFISTQNNPICAHMTLHSIDHAVSKEYGAVFKHKLWTHWISKNIDVDLKVVHPLNQELVPRYTYDYKFMDHITPDMSNVHEMIYTYLNIFQPLCSFQN